MFGISQVVPAIRSSSSLPGSRRTLATSHRAVNPKPFSWPSWSMSA